MSIENIIAKELGVKLHQVEAACQLLDEGSTVPFIARYRKEATGALDDQQLRQLDTRLTYLRELANRRNSILDQLEKQEKLTPELRQLINKAEGKTELEALYAPFKSKRQTKAHKAREAGLEALLDQIINQHDTSPETLAESFLRPDQGYPDSASALEGAAAILGERINQQPERIQQLQQQIWESGQLQVKVVSGQDEQGSKFRDYFSHQEALKSVPSHRMLAIERGIAEGVLKVSLLLENEDQFALQLGRSLSLPTSGAAALWLQNSLQQHWRTNLRPKLFKALLSQQRESAEAEAIQVFSRNLKALLLASPAGARTTLGLDPGLRTGVKAAVVDATGKLLEHATLYPHAPKNRWQEALHQLQKICQRHQVELISIGNGTASRETDTLVAELLASHPEIKAQKIVVSEAGASVYSASELASKEFPDLDVTIRGAISIARRLQDPLAELVKIEPKAIGVGQYQHDVDQTHLSAGLEAVIEDCVNAVGVDLNQASEAILSRISGLNSSLATNIVSYRDEHGRFSSRSELKKVKRLGPKAFEQAAAFLRIRDGKEVLDSSSVHPEAYSLVKRIAQQNGRSVESMIGESSLLKSLDPGLYTDDQFGLYTVRDVLSELDKPGRDPRPEFRAARFKEGINKITDLNEGMRLEGTVTNVTNFGAFVDIGVHQDGLVHISQLADRFVKDPHSVVKTGDIVQVRVTEVDVQRKRIALSMRSGETQSDSSNRPPAKPGIKFKQPSAAKNGSMAAAFAQAKQRS